MASGASHWLFLGAIWLLALGWCRVFAEWLWHRGDLDDLTQTPLEQLPELLDSSADSGLGLCSEAGEERPHLTVVVPACNEEENIEAAIRSILGSKGLRLQVIAVDDRSSDATGVILERLKEELSAGCPHTFEVLRVSALPEGWLGKPHALASGAKLAKADWILFTDADVKFAPEALSLALRYALQEQVDHLVLMPDWILGSAGEAAMHGALHANTAWNFRPWRIHDPGARDFLGVGAFNLIRREVYASLGGFESLRMEVLEDLRLGWKVKREGYRQQLVLGPGLVRVRWANGAWGVVRNLEKNLFALYRYRIGIAAVAAFVLAAQVVLPLAALAMGGWTCAGAVLLYLAVAGVYAVSSKVTRVPVIAALAFPIGTGLFLVAVVRSVALATMRKGIVWRGTLYSLKDLRAHAGPFW